MNTPIILLLKSLVAGYTRKDGTYVKPHSRKGGPAAKPGAGQLSLFAKPAEPAKPNPFKGKDPVKDTLPLFDADEHGEIPPARPAAVPVDGKANKKIDWSVGETLIPGHDVMAAWDADSAEGGHPDNLTVYMAGTNGAKDHIILEHGGKGVFAVTESVVENTGQGIGGKLYRALIDFLGSQGLTFHSDSELSPDSQRIYESLKKRGYRVETINAPARQANGWLVAGGPIYSVTAPAKSERTEPVHTAPKKQVDDIRTSMEKFRDAARDKGDHKQAEYWQGEIDKKAAREKRSAELHAQFKQRGHGFELKHGSRDSWAVLLPDASSPGKYRYQMYDKNGFSAHSTHDTPEKALDDAITAGYTQPDVGALERLSNDVAWQRGMELSAVVQAMNSKQISWEEGNKRAAEIVDRYADKKSGDDADSSLLSEIPGAKVGSFTIPGDTKRSGFSGDAPVDDYRLDPQQYDSWAYVLPGVGRSFSDEQKRSMVQWFKGAGWNAKINDKGRVVVFTSGSGDGAKLDDIPVSPAQKRISEKARAAAEASKKSDAEKQGKERSIQSTDAYSFVDKMLGDEANAFNKRALANYLNGESKKFEGIAGSGWADKLKQAGVKVGDGSPKAMAEGIKAAFAKPEPRVLLTKPMS